MKLCYFSWQSNLKVISIAPLAAVMEKMTMEGDADPDDGAVAETSVFQWHPSKHDTLSQRWLNVGPPSPTLDQH